MLEQGFVRPLVSPWSSPVWVVPKKIDASVNQKWHIVIIGNYTMSPLTKNTLSQTWIWWTNLESVNISSPWT